MLEKTAFNNWQKYPACTDYQVYIHTWSITDHEQRNHIISTLNTLGELEHNKMCGVTTINAQWGFVVIPPINFPEIKVCFRAEVNVITIAEVLDCIDKQLITNIVVGRGGELP